MRFDSLTFMLPFALVLALYRALPWSLGRWLLLLSSYVFYGFADPRFCLVLFCSSLIDFTAALLVHRGRGWMIAAVVANLSWLAVFKYTHIPHLLMPVGISFYTFKSLSYVIDVYKKRIEPTRDFVEFALYVAYFPQLVAGPIEKSTHLLPQLRHKSPAEWLEGTDRILVGLFKKCVLADRLGLLVDPVYANVGRASAAQLVAATLCFAFQLYWDFSGYTDIAIGMARLLGVRLSENFNSPFIATSPSDFWKRWHVTLTGWFREYLGGALSGGARPGPLRNLFNVIVIMTLIGLWHGASSNFILFGFVSGVELALFNWLQHRRPGRALGSMLWQFPLMLWMMTFFRAKSASEVAAISYGVFTRAWTLPKPFYPALALCALGLLAQYRAPPRVWLPLRWSALLLAIVWLSVSLDQAFIYYQF